MNRDQLFDAMLNRKPIYINGIRHLLNGMQMEDGSGYAFNLEFSSADRRGTNGTIFYRCQSDESKKLRHSAYYIDII